MNWHFDENKIPSNGKNIGTSDNRYKHTLRNTA